MVTGGGGFMSREIQLGNTVEEYSRGMQLGNRVMKYSESRNEEVNLFFL